MPLLQPYTSVTASSLLTLSYVGGLYLSSATRVGTINAQGLRRTKNDADVVAARLKAVSATTAAGALATVALLWAHDGSERRPFFRFISLLGAIGLDVPVPSLLTSAFPPISPSLQQHLYSQLRQTCMGLGTTAILYAGPFFVMGLDKELPGQRNFDFKRDVKGKWDNVWGLRNYVIGPLTEEVIFRGCILAISRAAGASTKTLVFATPLYFGIAHAHHAWEVYVDSGRTKKGAKRGLIHATFQFAYTCLFGWYANYLFLRTGTIRAPFAAHVLCNIMGLPNPGDAIQRHGKTPRMRWAIWTSHVLGIIGFAAALTRL